MSKTYIVIVGNLKTGFRFIGPFRTAELARYEMVNNHVADHRRGDAFVKSLETRT